MIKKTLSKRNGFSLIEIIIVVAIAASIVLVVSNLGSNVTTLNGLVSQELQSKSDINQTLQIVESEMRSAGPSANGSYAIESAATSSFVFFSDMNKDGTVERIRYFLATTTIYKGVTVPTGTPATYVTSTELISDVFDNIVTSTFTTSSPLFSYYDSSYTGSQPALTSTVDVSTIRVVKMAFWTDIQLKQSPGPQYFSLTVDVRNLRSN